MWSETLFRVERDPVLKEEKKKACLFARFLLHVCVCVFYYFAESLERASECFVRKKGFIEALKV